MIATRTVLRLFLPVAFLVIFSALAGTAQAGSYVVAQCSPNLYPGAPDAGHSEPPALQASSTTLARSPKRARTTTARGPKNLATAATTLRRRSITERSSAPRSGTSSPGVLDNDVQDPPLHDPLGIRVRPFDLVADSTRHGVLLALHGASTGHRRCGVEPL